MIHHLTTIVVRGLGMTKLRVSPRLVEKGGIGLVIWNLARRGLEAMETTRNSVQNDLWVSLGSDRIIRVEVKTGSTPLWNIRKPQIRTADFCVFVSLHSSRCWILNRESVLDNVKSSQHHRGDGVYTLTGPRLPPESEGAWHIITGTARDMAPRAVDVGRQARTVKKRLADGTIKTYHYPSTKRPPLADMSKPLQTAES